MMSHPPLVTIGMPVYNGLPYLNDALETLLAQDYANVELVISDNASSDGTSDVCRQLAERHPHILYHCNAENVGPGKNFHAVLERAKGKYFMWAAHDDKWDLRFVSTLVERLEAMPDAALATQTVRHMHEDGTPHPDLPDRPATADTGLGNLRILFEDHAPNWLYGLWRTDCLREHVRTLGDYPPWGADVLWLADACLRYKLVGHPAAIMYNRHHRNSLTPRTVRAAVHFWLYMFWYLSKISITRTKDPLERRAALAMSWSYVYRLCIRRPNIVRTAWRVVRMLSLAAITSLPPAIAYLWRRAIRAGQNPQAARN